MKHEKLSNALNEVSDPHITEAAKPKKKVRLPWLGAVAAVLVIAILIATVGRPTTVQAQGLIAAPEYPQMAKYSEANWDAWRQSQKEQYDQPEGYADGTEAFFRSSIREVLDSDSENQVYSPINVYMALAMLAETTGGESRQQLLKLLGSDSIEALRTQAGHMWNAHYSDDGLAASVLANSLWLDERLAYKEDAVNTLADSYYASVYRGALGSSEMNEALQSWLNEQTHGLLEEQAQGVELDPYTFLALASTVYYNVQWTEEFIEDRNAEGTFHAPGGDVDTTFMNHTLQYGPYYWGEDFGAVALNLRDGSRMWLVLPDEGYTPADLLESGHTLDMIFDSPRDYEDQKDIRINLSVPKFDIVSNLDLIPELKNLGITEIFDDTADFSPLIDDPDLNPYVHEVSHAARVSIDEKGVTAAAYTVIIADGAAADIEDEINFVLDRPFLFVIESGDGVPLFTGIVNEP